MKRVVSLLTICAMAVPVAEGVAKPVVFKVRGPRAGHVVVAQVTLAAKGKQKPKLRLKGRLPKGLRAVGAIAPLAKHKGRYVARIVLAQRKVKHGRSVRARAADVPQPLFQAFGATGFSGEHSVTLPAPGHGDARFCVPLGGGLAPLPTFHFDSDAVGDRLFGDGLLFATGSEAACDGSLPPGFILLLGPSPPSSGPFAPGRILLRVVTAVSLAADFDGTGGVNDIVVIDQARGVVFVLLDPGSGAHGVTPLDVRDLFSNTALKPTSATVFSDALKNLNDLAITDIGGPAGNNGAGQIIVGLNDGTGTFADAQLFRQFVASPGATNILDGDFNNDGIDDLAYIDFQSNFAAVALNDGTNFFLQPQFRETGGFIPVSATLADVNDDDNLDMVVLNRGMPGAPSLVTTLLGDGTGRLVLAGSMPVPSIAPLLPSGLTLPPGALIQTADVNGDHLPDLFVVTSKGVEIFENTTPSGSPTTMFTQMVTLPAGTLPVGVVVQDVSGDGIPDVLALNRGSGTVSTFFATASPFHYMAPRTSLVGANPISLSALSFDGDGHTDLLVATAPPAPASGFGNVMVLTGTGNGVFSPAQTFFGHPSGGTPGGGTPGGGNPQPSALSGDFSFTSSPSGAPYPVTGQNVDFSATASGGSGSYTYSWDLGDGSSGSGKALSHAFAQAGVKHVTLTINDGSSTVTVSHDVTVSAPTCDTPPSANIATANDPNAGPPGQPQVQFSALCPQFVAAGATDFGIIVPNDVYGADVHSPSCTPDVANPASYPFKAMICVLKKSGRICVYLYTNPPLPAGSQVQLALGDDHGPFPGFPITLTVAAAAGQPTCPTDDSQP